MKTNHCDRCGKECEAELCVECREELNGEVG